MSNVQMPYREAKECLVICEIFEMCGHNFKHRSSLLVHKASHNSKPTCQICNKSCTYITGLRRHMKLCISSDLQACRFCEKKMKQLREHEMFCYSKPRVKESFAYLQYNGVFKRKRYLASPILCRLNAFR